MQRKPNILLPYFNNKFFLKRRFISVSYTHLDVYKRQAPISVENFLKLIDQDFFAGLIFHRVIPGFMMQGGGYDKDFNHHEADSIKGEFRSNGVANDLLHTRGVLSMARTMVPDSASSQFFIMHADAPVSYTHLNVTSSNKYDFIFFIIILNSN